MIQRGRGRYVLAAVMLVLEAPLVAALAFGALVTRALSAVAGWFGRLR
jgi:hypothetical protein